jgi:hypothetical protein
MANLLNRADDEQATIYHGLDICPGRLETVFASVALFALRLMRPKPPINHARLEWFCACGVQIHADYPESDDIVEFQESLGDTQKRPPSFAHVIGVEGRLRLFRAAFPGFFGLVVAFTLMIWFGGKSSAVTGSSFYRNLGLLALGFVILLPAVAAILGEYLVFSQPSMSLCES